MTAPERGVVVFEAVDPAGDDARWCLEQYYLELGRRFDAGFDVHRSITADPEHFRRPHGVFLVGRLDGRPVACGAVTLTSPDVGYIKRMWVDGSVRGQGLGRRTLSALEDAARELGCSVTQLETNKTLTEAIRMYRTSGYAEVDPFNDEFYAHHWFEKRLERGSEGEG